MQNGEGTIVYMSDIVRSKGRKAVFKLEGISKYAMGKEVMMDILLLSKCHWFIHSASAVSESVFYENAGLHNRSVHLEFIGNRQVPFWL